jgi:hypothetical protein
MEQHEVGAAHHHFFSDAMFRIGRLNIEEARNFFHLPRKGLQLPLQSRNFLPELVHFAGF